MIGQTTTQDSREQHQKDAEAKRKMECLTDIFQKAGVKADIEELKLLIIANQDYTKVMQEYSDNLSIRQFELIKQVLSSAELEMWRNGKEISKPVSKKLQLDKLFIHQDIKHNLEQLKEALLNKNPYHEILLKYEDQFSGKQNKAIKSILSSKQLEALLDQDDRNQNKKLIANLFAHIKTDTSKLQSLLLKSEGIDELLNELADQLPGKVFNQIMLVIKSDELKNLLKDRKPQRSQKFQRLKKILHNQDIKSDITSLIEALALGKSIQQLLANYEENLSGKQFKALKKMLSSNQFFALIKTFQSEQRALSFDRLFSKIKTDLTKLKEAVLNHLDISRILRQYEDQLKGSQYKQMMKIISSQEFKSLFNKFEGEVAEKKKKIAKLLQQKYGLKSSDTSLIVEAVLRKDQAQEIIKAHSDDLTGAQRNKLIKFLESDDFIEIFNKDNKSEKQKRSIKKEDQLNFKTSVKSCQKNAEVQSSKKQISEQALGSTDKMRRSLEKKSMIKMQEVTQINPFEQMEKLKKQLKQINDLSGSASESEQQNQEIKTQPIATFPKTKQKGEPTLSILEKGQVVEQPDQRFLAIKQFFQSIGLRKNIDKLISCLCRKQGYDHLLEQYDEEFNPIEFEVLQNALKSNELRKLMGLDQTPGEFEQQIETINKLFSLPIIKEKNLQLIRQEILALNSPQSIMLKLKQNCSNKQFKQIKKLMECQQLTQTLKKLRQKDDRRLKIGKINKLIQEKPTNEKIKNLKDLIIEGKELAPIFQELKKQLTQDQINLLMQITGGKEIVRGMEKIEKGQNIAESLKNAGISSNVDKIVDLVASNRSVFSILDELKQIMDQKELKKLQNLLKLREPQPTEVKKHQLHLKKKTVLVNDGSRIIDIRNQYQVNDDDQFFTLNNQPLYPDAVVKEPIKLLRCSEFNILFQGQNHPLNLPLLTIAEVTPILQKLLKTNLKLKIRVFKKEEYVQEEQNFSLQLCSSRNLSVSYYITLLAIINQKQSEFPIVSSQTIRDIKDRIETKIGIKKKSQRWYLDGKQIIDEKLTIQKLGIKTQMFRICIQEQRTLQFYGFNKVAPIKRNTFKQFYIEDDDLFINVIKSSDFPKASYSQVFRNQALGYIFSAIKKHSLIESSLKHIQGLVEKSEKEDLLWKPPSIKEKCLFNQSFVLYYIIKCCDTSLRIDILRGLMSNMPVPLSYYDQKDKINYLFTQNFWIQNKAFNICSLSLEEVMGKSSLLNILFETNFTNREFLHKDCRGGIQIQYNIFQLDQYNLNLIDISNDVTDEIKIQFAQACNLLVIHYKQSEQRVQQWIKNNKITQPYILIQRDIEDALDKQKKNERNQQKKMNQQNPHVNKYKIMEVSEESINHYNSQVNQIANGVQEFVRKRFVNQNKNEFWKLTDFLAKKVDKRLLEFNNILKDIERSNEDLTRITNYFNQYKIIEYETEAKNEKINLQKMECIKAQAIKAGLASPIKRILLFYKDHLQLSSQIMTKVRIFLNLLRNQLFKDFNSLQLVLKEEKNKNKQFEALKQELIERVTSIFKLKDALTTPKVQQTAKKFLEQAPNYKSPSQWQAVIKTIKTQFQFEIQPKAFSVENFWREVIYMTKFDPNYQLVANQEKIKLIDSITQLGRKEVQESQNFEFINGDLLEMPTQYLTKIFESQQDKKIMVVAIFGPQSSGKSTLLNFVLGCDFMSSAGRCTKGIYGTYFEISNRQIPNCEAILVLDTEGLFSNYENKKFSNRNGFDNKLVLFCLQVCDVIILNTKGDVTKDCQQILQLAFDSEILDPNNLPEIYFVLNLNGGQINSTQSREIEKFCQTIVNTNPQAAKVINKNHAIGMPMAFNEVPRKSTAQQITKFLKPKTLPSERFYRQTKRLCFDIMGLIHQRGNKREGRTLQQAFVQMDKTWSTINKYPILTKHGNKKLRLMEESVSEWKKQKIQALANLGEKIESESNSKRLDQLEEWSKKQQKMLLQQIQSAKEEYKQKFPQKPGEIQLNNLISQLSIDIEPLLSSSITSLKMLVQKRRFELQIAEADMKGFDNINYALKQIKQEAAKSKIQISNEQKTQKFEQCWKQRQGQMNEKLDRQKNSEEIYTNLIQIYNSCLQEKKGIKSIVIKEKHFIINETVTDWKIFQSSLRKKFVQQFKTDEVFESSNQPPVMNIEKKIGDLTFKYLDISKYFQHAKSRINLSINIYDLKQCISLENIQRYINKVMEKKNLCQQLVKTLCHQFRLIGVVFDKNSIKKSCQQHLKYKFYKIWTWGCKQITRSDIRQLYSHSVQLQYQGYDYQKKIVKKKEYGKKYNSIDWLNSHWQNRQIKLSHPLKILKYTPQLTEYIQKIRENMVRENNKHLLNQHYAITEIFSKIANYAIKQHIQSMKDQDSTYQIKFEKQKLERQIIQKIQNDLKLINLRVINEDKIFSQNNDILKFESINQNYQFKHEADAKKILDHFSQFWYLDKLQRVIQKRGKSQSYYQKSFEVQIGYFQQIQISIIKEFQNNEILKKYIKKQYNEFLTEMKRSNFTKFVAQELKHELALDDILEQCINQKLSERDLKQGVHIIINKINNVVQEINKDLKQVSQKVRYDFIAELHDYAFHLIWKLKESYEWGKKESILVQFNNKKQNELERFIKMASGSPQLENSACADQFVELYVKFINQLIKKQKNKYLKVEREEYKKLYSRSHVQTTIDTTLHKSDDANEIFKYLIDPITYTMQVYRKRQKLERQKLQGYKYLESNKLIKDLLKCLVEFRDSTDDQEKSISEQIFEGVISENKNEHFLPLFIEVLVKKAKPYVSSDNSVGLKIKQGRVFKIKEILCQNQNIYFLESLKHSGIQMSNLKIFLDQLVEKITKLLDSLDGILVHFSDEEIKQYQNSIAVNICKQQCPCCKRCCDVDLQFDVNHKIHKCNSGHQMRAIGGMRIEYQENGVKQYKASIQRCEDLSKDYQFEFNNKNYKWSEFKAQKINQWDLNFQENENSNQELFRHYWQKAQWLIRDHYQTVDQIPMGPAKYDAAQLKLQALMNRKAQPTHYIFALDQSGSMSGSSWDQLIKAMKSNIQQIVNVNQDSTQRISIFKFNGDVSLVAENEDPSKFDTNRIIFGSGGTLFSPAFQLGYEIMRKTPNVNNVFVLVSDGQAEYPQSQVQKIKAFKDKQKIHNLSVDYVSILIGSYGGAIMQQIKVELGGRHNTVSAASGFSSVFKQVMKGKAENK